MVGGGIIGLSLSIELRKRGASVLVIERAAAGARGFLRRRWHAGNCGTRLRRRFNP